MGGSKREKRLPERDPVTTAVVALSFVLLVVWFVWSLLFPPGLRVPPGLRTEPIPRDYGLLAPPLGPPQPAAPGSGPPFTPGAAPPASSAPATGAEEMQRQ